MEISHDSKADAVYIRLQKGKFASNRKINDDTIVDLDSRGRVLGIEILNVSKKKGLEEVTVELAAS